MTNVKYVKGSLKGGIHNLTTTGIYCACTETMSKTFKTLKGAERFMENKGYERSDK